MAPFSTPWLSGGFPPSLFLFGFFMPAFLEKAFPLKIASLEAGSRFLLRTFVTSSFFPLKNRPSPRWFNKRLRADCLFLCFSPSSEPGPFFGQTASGPFEAFWNPMVAFSIFPWPLDYLRRKKL